MEISSVPAHVKVVPDRGRLQHDVYQVAFLSCVRDPGQVAQRRRQAMGGRSAVVRSRFRSYL
ncbi:MAG: hypothetical protein O3A25_15430 [Acidobacteria bacterium]|nr:hypothetical protein [Acidobacteriota bacterium]